MQSYLVGALHRIMPQELTPPVRREFFAVRNDRAYFQWAIVLEPDARPVIGCVLTVESELVCRVRRVGLVPNDLPTRGGHDDYILSDRAGLYPDVLGPIDGETLMLNPCVPNVFFVEVETSDVCGPFSVCLALEADGERIAADTAAVTVSDASLGTGAYRYTDWIHYDSIAAEHGVRLFDADFYGVFASYLDLAAASGMNMLMVPAFTPALDTYVGGDRMTAQLVDIARTQSGYSFDFARLDAFLSFAESHGIRYWEFPPLFCQWTARYGVKFVIDGDAAFGWSIESHSDVYLGFLTEFLYALGEFLRRTKRIERSYFHLSDELSDAADGRFVRFRTLMRESLDGAKFFDTVSRAGDRADGFEDVVALDHADEGIAGGYAVTAVYYCWEQSKDRVSNRFLNMPLARAAVIGAQMYLNGATLLLHWGFNFYNSALSYRRIDPYADTTCGGVYPGGDAFVVYPDRVRGEAVPSLRLYAIGRAFRVYRLLERLESQRGREAALAFLRAEGLSGYSVYPIEDGWFEDFERNLIEAVAAK